MGQSMAKTSSNTATLGYNGFWDAMARHASMDNSKRNGLGLTDRWPPRPTRSELWANINKGDRVILCNVNIAKIANDLAQLCRRHKIRCPFTVPEMPEYDIDSIHKRGGNDKGEIKRYAFRAYEKAKKNMKSKVSDKANVAATAKNFATFLVKWQERTAHLQKSSSKLNVSVEGAKQDLSLQTKPEFRPGCPNFVENTTVSRTGQTGDVELRHKKIQMALYKHLCQEVGHDNVQVERPVPSGLVDAAVRHNGKESFYEVKVVSDIRSCMREALGQLLEYAHWPSADHASELIVVGEAEVDADSRAYLQFLRQRFGLPLWYCRIDMNREILEEKL